MDVHAHVQVGAWAFVLGYCIQTLISLVSEGTQLLRDKGQSEVISVRVDEVHLC